jgi:hypothetical protein
MSHWHPAKFLIFLNKHMWLVTFILDSPDMWSLTFFWSNVAILLQNPSLNIASSITALT